LFGLQLGSMWGIHVPLLLAAGLVLADASVVTLALPPVIAELDASVEQAAAVLGVYTFVLAVALPLVARLPARTLGIAGGLLFGVASAGCGLADSIEAMLVLRGVQALGGATLLVGAFTLLDAAGARRRVWTAVAIFGFAAGPALGGALTQAFDWRAIFVAQAPVAGAALLATYGTHVKAILDERPAAPIWRTVPANLCLALIFGALVGTLFLGVLLVINAFGYSPIAGAGIVSVIPAATLAARPLATRLPGLLAVTGGALLLALGLVGLAFLPSSELVYSLASFALCGFGIGLSVPGLTRAALSEEVGLTRSGTFTIGVRHLGLVLALVLVAPILANDLTEAGDVAKFNATAVIIDGQIPITKKIPLALDMRDVFDAAQKGEIPDFTGPFDKQGAQTDEQVATLRDDLVSAIEEAITRGFRTAFLVSALLAALAVIPALAFRRRVVAP
jgi:MFS family permease